MFKYKVVDDFFPADAIAVLSQVWPTPDWSGWVNYDPRFEAKKASDLKTALPPAIGTALAAMAWANFGIYLGEPDTVADTSLYGSGLHEVPPGGQVGCHLDASHHPRLGLKRAWTAIMWVHPSWLPGCGGELVLRNEVGFPVVQIEPKPGRLALFRNDETAWHSVSVVMGPNPRRSLSIFGYYAMETGPAIRPRALFRAAPGEDATPEAVNARLDRSRRL